MSVREYKWKLSKRETKIRDSAVLTRDIVYARRECDPLFEPVNEGVQKLLDNWNSLTACLDLIGDSSYALSEFIQNYPKTNTGAMYLYVYGAVQALNNQQDAVRTILSCFDIEVPASKGLMKIRQTRIDLAHSDKIERKDERKQSGRVRENVMLGRFSLKNPCELKIMLASSTLEDEMYARKGMQSINLPALILEQDELLSQVVDDSDIMRTLDHIQLPLRLAAEAADSVA